MKKNLFRGRLVRLIAGDPGILAENYVRWGRNTEFTRHLFREPAVLWSAKKYKDWIEQDIEKDNPDEFFFDICTLDNERPIGFIGLFNLLWNHGDAMVSIGIGDPENWGRGYGTDAMLLILRYAFQELNIQRVTLGVFDYNKRAIRSYEKAGFKLEGRVRQAIQRDGAREDVLYMGVLREEWEAENELHNPGSLEYATEESGKG